MSASDIEFDLEAVAQDQKLDPAKTCLVGKTFKADGTYDLIGRFQGHGKAEDLLKTATGQVAFTAKDGRIYYDAILIEVRGQKAEDRGQNLEVGIRNAES